MLVTKLFFCFAAAIVIFSGVESIRAFEYGAKFTCEQICQNYLSGKTYICELTGKKEKVTTVIRMVGDLNWRFYVIPKFRSKSLMCKRIAAGDTLFINGGERCPSYLRSEKDQIDRIDPNNLQSNHRAGDIKRLLKEINRNTADVLKDLKRSLKGNGLVSPQFSLTRHKKMKMKFFLEELMELLSFYAWLNDDIKYHEKNSKHPSNPKQPNETVQLGPNDQQGEGGYPNSFGGAKPLDRPGQFGETGQFSPDDQQGEGGYPNSFGRPKPFSGANQPSNPCNPNNEGHSKHNFFWYSFYPCKNQSSGGNFEYYDPRPQEEPENTYDYVLKPNSNKDVYTTYKGRPNYNYRSLETRAEDPSQVNKVKKLALRLNEETSKVLKQLEDGSPDGLVKKRYLFESVLNHLEAFVNLIFTDGYTLLEKIWNDSIWGKDTSNNNECFLCTIVLRDICKDHMLVSCNEKYCCWKSYDPFYCKIAQKDKTADECYNTLFNILLSSRLM